MLALVHENLSSCMGIDHMESEWRTHMMHPAAVKPNKIALFAKIMVAKYLGFLPRVVILNPSSLNIH